MAINEELKQKRVKTLIEVIDFIITASKYIDWNNLELLDRVLELKQDIESGDLTEREVVNIAN